MVTAIIFIVVIGVLVLVHEFGHFIMAKRAGMKVEEFG
ncbi:MAG TPA: site-2 protease family protein, partial [Candidatus Paceibacterota bacterium]|nr:site-2 protease family protein [Candidatus Paceibacterota bacterium]